VSDLAVIGNKAGFGLRFLASLIDGVIMGVVGSLLGRLAYNSGAPLLNTLVGALYSILLWVNWNGQTVGKKALGIKVVKEDGSSLDYQTAVIRYLCYFVSAIPLGLGYFWVIWDEKKQGWHDKIAKTLVVKE